MSRSKVKGQGHLGQTNEKLLSHLRCVRRTQQAATDDTVGIMTSQQA